MSEYGDLTSTVLRTLEERGPMTCSQLSGVVGQPTKVVATVLGRLVEGGRFGQRAHIPQFTMEQEGGRRYPRAIYAAGPGVNATKPASKRHGAPVRPMVDCVTSVFALGRRA